MRADDFDTRLNHLVATGDALKRALAHTLTECELDSAGHKAKLVDDLLVEARAILGAIDDATAPTVSTRTQAAGVRTIVIACSEGLDPTVQVPTSAFAITSPARTITGVRILGASILVDYTGVVLEPGDTPEIAYTQPVDTTVAVRDQAGNLLATFAAAAVTVAA